MTTPTPPTEPGNQGGGTEPAARQPLPFPVPGGTQRATSFLDHAHAAVSAIMGERDEPLGPRVDTAELGQSVADVLHAPVGMTGDAVATPMRPNPPTLPATPPGQSPHAQYLNSVAHQGVSNPRSMNGIGLSEQARMMGASPQTAPYQPPPSFNGVGQSDRPQPQQ
jgi:hypothetical protein